MDAHTHRYTERLAHAHTRAPKVTFDLARKSLMTSLGRTYKDQTRKLMLAHIVTVMHSPFQSHFVITGTDTLEP